MYLITFGRKLGSTAIPIGYTEMLVSRQVGEGMYVPPVCLESLTTQINRLELNSQVN